MNRLTKTLGLALLGLTCAVALTLAFSDRRDPQPVPVRTAARIPRASADRPPPNPLKNAYFGETHLHTRYSLDANLFGTKNDPRLAYRFARGEEITLSDSGLKQRIVAPLDFAAVTDHAEGMGMYAQCSTPGSGSYWSVDCIGMRHQVLLLFPRLFRNNLQDGSSKARYSASACGEGGRLCIDAARGVWQDTIDAANEAYEPGRFTTLIGFEYSPTLLQGGMLHRNVIFRGDTVPGNVFSAGDGFAEDLLRWLDTACTGECRALSIPHNPNFSWGLMFGDTNADGSPVTRENLALRARYERLVEIFQAKGSSECALGVGSSDEECSFENLWPACTREQLAVDATTGLHGTRCVGPVDLVRGVLRRGLVDERKWGFNPYRLGFVGGTDNHNGAPGDTAESTYKGHGGSNDATPELRLGTTTNAVIRTLGFPIAAINPGGLTGVWAEENTREAIWDAMQRRETWGTSGTRIRVRFFAGYDFPRDLHRRADMVEFAHASGVPMGGALRAATTGRAPAFVVWALRDANSAPLQRVQIVKGWTTDGRSRERVFDVACSDGLAPDARTHRCADNGASVELRDCSVSKDRGASEIAASWTDPDFHADQSAFYYVRVLENPSCRYTQRDATTLGVPHPGAFPATIQERAWSSPIWYDAAAH
jgi:hypothetical protein